MSEEFNNKFYICYRGSIYEHYRYKCKLLNSYQNAIKYEKKIKKADSFMIVLDGPSIENDNMRIQDLIKINLSNVDIIY